LNTANSVLTFFFVAEAALKVSTWGRSYFMDPFNCYDFVVTVLALATFFIPTTSGGLSGLRAVRILRLLRLLTVLPALQRFLRVLGKVLLKCFAFFGIVTLTGGWGRAAAFWLVRCVQLVLQLASCSRSRNESCPAAHCMLLASWHHASLATLSSCILRIMPP
jgi:hypothetical protein